MHPILPGPADVSPWFQQMLEAVRTNAGESGWSALAAPAASIAAILLGPLLLYRQARRQGPDPIGQVKAEAYRGMLRSSLLFLGGCVITALNYVAASEGGTYVVFWGAMVFGGLALFWRLLSYFLRTKPRLDALAHVTAAPPTAYPAAIPRKTGLGFWGWLGVIALGYLLLNGAARILYSASIRPGLIDDARIVATNLPAEPTRPTATRPSTDPTAPGIAPAPIPTPAPPTWGLHDQFREAQRAPLPGPDGATWDVALGVMRLSVREPSRVWWRTVDQPSEGRDVRFRAEIASTAGEGQVVVLVLTDDGEPIWAFNVDPSAGAWSVDRMSEARDVFFPWVEPRAYTGGSVVPLSSVEVRIAGGVPTLFVNGRDVMTPAEVRLDAVPASIAFGFGGAGAGFTVKFDAITLAELEP